MILHDREIEDVESILRIYIHTEGYENVVFAAETDYEFGILWAFDGGNTYRDRVISGNVLLDYPALY